MASRFCSRTYHLGDPRLIELIRTVAHIEHRTESAIIADAVEYRFGPNSPVVERDEEELPLAHLISEGDGDDV
jgi:hypothetical protein